MGMYTELVCAMTLKKDIPKDVLEILEYMIDNEDKTCPPTPKHNFFDTSRWYWMLHSDSCYFSGDSDSTLRYDDDTEDYYLTVRCNIKNYGCEIEYFLEWLTPYIDMNDNEFLGYKRYEQNDSPTLLYFFETGIVSEEVR